MPVPVLPLSKSIVADASEKYKSIITLLVNRISIEPNWYKKNKVFLSALDSLKSARKDADSNDLIQEMAFLIGGVLETFNESEIDLKEQAIFYLMSAHLEHQMSVDKWIEISPKHAKILRRYCLTNSHFKRIVPNRFVYNGLKDEDGADNE